MIDGGGNQLIYLTKLAKGKWKCSLLNWQSKQIKRVVRSIDAKTSAARDVVDDAVH